MTSTNHPLRVPPLPDSEWDERLRAALMQTGIQQDVLDPIFGLIGPLGGLFTS